MHRGLFSAFFPRGHRAGSRTRGGVEAWGRAKVQAEITEQEEATEEAGGHRGRERTRRGGGGETTEARRIRVVNKPQRHRGHGGMHRGLFSDSFTTAEQLGVDGVGSTGSGGSCSVQAAGAGWSRS